ncbi:MAG: GH3 auxin-responsive promoter family protein, partial [Chloroflexota bacterium]
MQNTKYPMVTSENDRFWSRYCGFFDLSLSQFMVIQETTLMQHLQRVAASDLGKDIMGSRPPQSVEEFRNRVPLTTYEDYIPYFREDRVSALPARPHVWAHTSSGSRSFKLVPYTTEFYNRQLDSLMAVLILSCSKRKGQSSIQEYDRVLHNVAPMPYLSGILASGASERFNLVPIITPDEHDGLDFKEKVAKGFELSLASGVDIIIAMTSVLVKMGHDFNRRSSRSQKSQYLAHPKVLCRYARAWLRSRLRGRNILPKDLWPVRSVIGWGTDTRIYREQVREYWGTYPYEFHACTEAGIMAMQSWNRGDLTLLPYSNFFEFI